MAKAFSHISGNPMFYFPSKPNPNRPFPLLLPFNKPLKFTMSCSKSYWVSIDEDIEAHLKQAIPVREPLSVFEPLHHLTFATPPNTAPSLCVAACEMVGGDRDHAFPAASAIHLVHAASFVHEHLRRNETTRHMSKVQHVFPPSIELEIGDAMVPLGLEILAKSDDPAQNNSDRILRMMVEITRATGSQGMIHGQYYEVEPYESGSHTGWIEHVSAKCEGTLHACAAACGAIIGGGSEEEIEKMRKYGLHIGKMQGIMSRIGSNDNDLMKKMVEELRNLARNELRGFNEAKVKALFNSRFSPIDSCNDD